MELHALTYDLVARTWSGPLPDADSERTLVLALGAPAALAMADLRRSFPRSVVVGCGAPGGPSGDLAVTLLRFEATRVRSLVVPRGAARAGAEAVAAEFGSPELRAVLLLGPDTQQVRRELIGRFRGVAVAAEQPSGSGSWLACGTADTSRAFVAVGLFGQTLVVPDDLDGEAPDLLVVGLSELAGGQAVESDQLTVRTTAFDARTQSWSSSLPADLDSPNTLVLAFGAAELADRRAPLDQVVAAFPTSTVFGCSTMAPFGGEHALAVSVLRFGRSRVVVATADLRAKGTPLGVVQELPVDARDVGARLAASLRDVKRVAKGGAPAWISPAGEAPDPRDATSRVGNVSELRAVLVFAAGAILDGAALVHELSAALPPHTLVAGGVVPSSGARSAGGAGRLGSDGWLFVDGELRTDRVVAIGLYGDHLVVTQAAGGGWQVAGPERRVTRVSANVLYELDSGLALEVYREDLGVEEHELPDVAVGQVFAFRGADPADRGEVWLRTVMAYDQHDGTLVLSADVPVGSVATLLRGVPSDLVRSVEQAVGAAVAERYDRTADALALVVSAAGRRAVLGGRAHEEAEAARRVLGGIPVGGLYVAAEITTTGVSGAVLQDQVFTVTTIREVSSPVPPRRAPDPAPLVVSTAEPQVSRKEPPRRPTMAVPPRGSVLTVHAMAADGNGRLAPAPAELDSAQTLALVVGSANGGPESAVALARQLPHSHVVGIAARNAGVSAIVARFGWSQLLAEVVPAPDPARSYDVGRRLAAAVAHPALRVILVFGRAEQVRGVELVRGLTDAVGTDVAVAGALAARAGWWTFGNGEPNGVLAIGLAGEGLSAGVATRGGVDPYPPERRIGRTNGPAVYEIDGRPASTVVRSPVGRGHTPALGLGFTLQQVDDPARVHRVVAIDERSRSILVDPPIEMGTLVHLVRDDEMWLPLEVRDAASAALAAVPPTAPTGFAFAFGAPPVGAMLTERDFGPAREVMGGKVPLATLTVGEVLGRNVGRDAPALVLAVGERASRDAEVGPSAAVHTLHTVDEESAAEAARRRPTTPLPPQGPERVVQSGGGRPSAPPPPPPPPTPRPGRADPLVVTRNRVGEVQVVALAGRLTEAFQGERLGRELAGTTVVDLGGVERITSFGVREWLALLRICKGKAEPLYLSRCTEPFVNQLTMIRGFAGHGQIVSFLAPYVCSTCGTSYSSLLDAERDRPALLAGIAPATQCPRCGSEGSFDDEESSYFSLVSNLAEAVPAEIRAAIDAVEPAARAEPIEKVVDERSTRIVVAAAVDGATRWAQALDGVEGPLVLDFSRSPAATPEGAENLERVLRGLVGEVPSVTLVAAPRWIAERLIGTRSPLPRVEVFSMVADSYCPACAANRSVVLPVADHAARILAGTDPDVPCPKCSGALSFEPSRDLLGSVVRASVPEPAPAIGPIVGMPPTDPSALLTWTRTNSRALAPMVAVGVVSSVVAIVLFTLFLVVLYLVWSRISG